ncbi:hypothetical protein ACM9W9_18015 [Xanthomonas sacchari]
MNANDRVRGSGRDVLAVLLFVGVGVLLYQMKASAYLTSVPGDLIDARFNSVILEHLHQWVLGQTPSLWSPGFFYPAKDVLALGPNHLGSFLPYSAMRLIGLDREQAFTLWFILGGVLNFLCAYIAFRKLGLRASGAGAAAFVFAFSLPVLAQQAHAQFAYRMFVPFAFACFYDWLRTARPYALAWSALCLMAQFYCSIDVGVFTVYLLIAMLLAWLIAGRGGEIYAQVRSFLTFSKLRESLIAVAVISSSCALVLVLLLKCREAIRENGVVYSHEDVIGMLPQVWSYLIADYSGLTRDIGAWIQGVSVRQEQQLFIGVGVLLFCLIGSLVVLRKIENADLGKVSLLATLVLIVGTLNIGAFSLYPILLNLPGIAAVKVVTRVLLVMVVPIGILCGIGFQRMLMLHCNGGALRQLVSAAFLFVLLVLESVMFQPNSTPFMDWRARLDAFASRVPEEGRGVGGVLFAERSMQAPYMEDLDAMMYAQDHGMVTANGYSFYVPKGAGVAGSCDSPDRFVASYGNNAGLSLTGQLDIRQKIVVVPFGTCRP